MAKKELDKDTRKVDADGEALKGLTEHDGWMIAKQRLIKRVANLLTITSPDIMQATPETLLALISGKKTAADELMGWLKDIEGSVEQHKANKQLIDQSIESFILEVQ